jgi:hypothetical protein
MFWYNVLMTTLEKFISFAKTLDGDQRGSLDAVLTSVMESYSDNYALTEDELAEIDRRVADPNLQLASDAEITAIFGKSINA